jgi:hypothetical protein
MGQNKYTSKIKPNLLYFFRNIDFSNIQPGNRFGFTHGSLL